MARTSKHRIIISQETVERRGGLVVLTLKEYRKLLQLAVPTTFLKGWDAKKLDRLVETGLKEHRQGRTKTIQSLADLDS